MKKLLYIVLLIPFISVGQLIWDSPLISASEWSTNGDSPNYIWETNQYVGNLVGNGPEGDNCLSLAALPTEIRNEFNANSIWQAGNEYWIGFAYKIVVETANLRPFIQIRQANGNTTNPFTMRCAGNGEITVDTCTDSALGDAAVDGSGGGGSIKHNTSFVLNQWHYLVMNVNWDHANGFIKVWIDGNEIVDLSGTTFYRKDSSGNITTGQIYPKIGPYPGSVAAKVGEIHYSRYKSWGSDGTYELVHPLGLSLGGVIPDIDLVEQKKKAAIRNVIAASQ